VSRPPRWYGLLVSQRIVKTFVPMPTVNMLSMQHPPRLISAAKREGAEIYYSPGLDKPLAGQAGAQSSSVAQGVTVNVTAFDLG
jgi:hypothetical protein